MDDERTALAPTRARDLICKFKKLIAAVYHTGFIIGGMVALVIVGPVFKFGLFHYLAWKGYREKGFTVGGLVFLFACLPVDIGLLICVWFLITGEWPGQ